MKEFFKRHDILTKLLALILAVGLWLFVMNTEKLERTLNFSVPLNLIGEEQLLSEHQLAVIGGQEGKVSLSVTGTTPGIFSLNASDIQVSVDVTGLTEAKTYENLELDVSLPLSTASLKVKSIKPSVVNLTVDKVISQEIPVRVQLEGNAADGLLLDTPQPDTSSIMVRGPRSLIEQIDCAYVGIAAEEVTQTQTLDCGYALVNAEGTAVDTRYLSYPDMQIRVKVVVNKLATLPLRVELRESGEITEDMATVKIDPATIQVYGEPEKIDALQEINLGVIDLATAQNEQQILRSIRLPSGISAIRGQAMSAYVVVQIDGMELRNLTLDEVNLIDTNTSPDKPVVTLRTTSIDVTLRGKSSALNSLNEDSINVSVQFDSSALSEGTHRLPVAVTLPTSAITVIDYTETVTIQVGSDITTTTENTTQSTTQSTSESTSEAVETTDTTTTEEETAT